MFFYFSFSTYFRLIRLAAGESDPRARRKLLTTLLWKLPCIASFHALCFFLDNLLFPGLRKVEVRAPIFIVGHARSGTTLLHRLMTGDDERFSYFLHYELFLPSILQKKVVRACAALDRRYLGRRIEKRVRAWEERKYGATQHIHQLSLTEPEEDETVAYHSCDAGWWITKLPYMGQLDFYHIDQRPERRRRRLLRFYRDCLRRQLYLNGPHKIHLAKNPIFAGRMQSLIDAFPDARFVIPFRNPDETIPSLLKLLQTSWALRGWSAERMKRSLRVLAEQSFETYRYPLEVLERHPEIRRAIVDYRALVEHPRDTLARVYAELGLPLDPAFDEMLKQREARARAHTTRHRYSLEEFGLERDAIRAELGPLFARFGWDRDAAAPETRGA